MNLLRKLRRNKDAAQYKESHYCAVINGKMSWYDSKESMLKGVEAYSRVNSVYELSLFRYDLYSLIK